MKRYDDYLLVTDLDGTLYKRQNDVPQINIDAIERFTSKGGHFAIATGRGVEAARFITENIDITAPSIVNNGHAIYDYKTDEFVLNIYLPERIKQFTFEIMDAFPECGVEIYSDRPVYVLRDHPVVTHHLSYESMPIDAISRDTAAAMQWSKLLVADDEENLIKIIDYSDRLINEKYHDDGFKMIRTNRLFFEGIRVDINKGTAVHELARHLGLSGEHIYTIGNYYNDVELVSCAYGAWISGSPEELLKYGKYVTKKSCEEGGFAEFIDHIMAL